MEENSKIKFKYSSPIDTKDIAISEYNEGFAELAREEDDSKINVLAVVFIWVALVVSFWLGFGFHAWIG